MTDRELMQMALDSLLRVWHSDRNIKHSEAIDTIHARLAQPEPEPYPDDFIDALRYHTAISEQPEQEPVAWMYDWYDETEDIDGVPIGGIVHDWISKDYDEAHSPTMGCHNIRPLYTAPPQREWQGLTDADIAQTMHGSVEGSNMLPYQFARAIEAKLKEKNT